MRKIDADALIDWLEDAWDEQYATEQEKIDHAFMIGAINAMPTIREDDDG